MLHLRLLVALAVAAGLSFPLSAPAQEGPPPISPFNERDTSGWKLKGDEKKAALVVGYAQPDAKNLGELAIASTGEGKPQLINAKHGALDFYTEEKFGDAIIRLEFMIPKGSNSGVYVMGEYEVQIIDSFGKPDDQLKQGDMGGLYTTAIPRVNAAKQPGEWQSLTIQFRAPKFVDGKKTANAVFERVILNGKVIHEKVEMKGVTPGGLTGKEAATGPLMFQGNHGPVAYRDLVVLPLFPKK